MATVLMQQAQVQAQPLATKQVASPQTYQQPQQPVAPQQRTTNVATNNPAPTAPTAPPQPKTAGIILPTKTSTISISQNIPVAPNTENEKKNNEIKLTLDIVEKLWSEYAEMVEDKNLHFAMSQTTIEVNDNRLFTVKIDNSYIDSTIRRNRKNILDYMREKTGIKVLDFLTSVTKQEHQKMVYNPTDKFEYLKEKNSLIVNLRRTFKNIDF
jgi:hypothetical protein